MIGVSNLSDITGFIGKTEPLQLDFSDECHTPARDLYSIGTCEGCGELDVALDVDVRREDDVVILIEQLHGGADGVGRGRQRVTVEIEDGEGDGGLLIGISWICGINVRCQRQGEIRILLISGSQNHGHREDAEKEQ